MSKRTYYMSMLTWLAMGIAVSVGFGWLGTLFKMSTILFVGLVLCSLIGALISTRSQMSTSILGYFLMSSSSGMLLGYSTLQSHPINFIGVTAGTVSIAVVMGAFGLIYPKSLERFYSYLLGILVALILLIVFVPFGAMRVIDWVGIALFGLLVLVDFNVFSNKEPSKKVALDFAINIYLDILNIFARLMGISVKDK